MTNYDKLIARERGLAAEMAGALQAALESDYFLTEFGKRWFAHYVHQFNETHNQIRVEIGLEPQAAYLPSGWSKEQWNQALAEHRSEGE